MPIKYDHALNDTRIKAAKPGKKPYKLTDGDGLYIEIFPNSSKLWRYKYLFDGIEKRLALGAYPAVGLSAARALHEAAQLLRAQGKDPSIARREEKEELASRATFQEVAEAWMNSMRRPLYANGKLGDKSIERNEREIARFNLAFGDKAMADLKVSDLASALGEIENEGKFETRMRAQGTAIAIGGFAFGRGMTDRNPFSDVKFAQAFTSPAAKHRKRPAVVQPDSFGTLLRKVDQYEGREDNLTGYGLKLMTYAWPRPGDVIQAEWSHFDMQAAKWSIPADTLKMRTHREKSRSVLTGEAHEVPLSRQALALLANLRKLSGKSQFLFPGRQKARTMSENTLNNALIAMGYKDIHCAHGFRSSASTLLNAQRIMIDGRKVRQFERAVIEIQLDHEDETTRAIYDRDGLWEERVELMQVWADLVDGMRLDPSSITKPKLHLVA